MKSVSRLFFVVTVFLIMKTSGQSLEEANLLMMQEDFKGALLKLSSIINADSSNLQAAQKLGLCYLGLNYYSQAVKVLEYASAKDSQNTSMLLSLGKAYKSAGNYQKAKDVYRSVLKKDSMNVTALVNLAALNVDLQDYNNAKNFFIRLNGLDSTNSYYLKQIGLCLFKLENLKSASEYYEKALRWNRSDISAALDLSLIYFKMEKLDSAFMIIHKVYGLYGDDARLDKMLGEIHMKRKDYVYSEKYFRRAVHIGDTSSAVLQKLGIAIYLVGAFNSPPDSAILAQTFNEAKEYLEQSYKMNNKDAMTSLYLGLAYKELHDYPSAIKFIEEAVNLAIPPYVSDMYNYLATAYNYNGDYQKALKTYNEALEHNPANISIYYYLAFIYDQRFSEREIAIKYYQKYIDWPEGDRLLKAFAQTRLDKLKEEQFFRTGSSQLK